VSFQTDKTGYAFESILHRCRRKASRHVTMASTFNHEHTISIKPNRVNHKVASMFTKWVIPARCCTKSQSTNI